MFDYLIVGSGFSGAVLAERLASVLNKKVCVVEKRNHIGGNAYDYINTDGILVHKYGPHWFHTNSDNVFNYLSKFTEWIYHNHIVKSNVEGKLYQFPINRNTINSFFNLNLSSEKEVERFLEYKKLKIQDPQNSEEMVLSLLGKELYEKFYLNYTLKQWNIHPRDLSPTITARIPVRLNNQESYFNDKYQVMPKLGYTNLFEELLGHDNITLILNEDFADIKNELKFNKLIYTGPLDEYFNYCHGELPYRSLEFEHKTFELEYFQDCQQINYPNENEYTRIIEWKHATGQKSSRTSIMMEYPVKYNSGGERFYPIPLSSNNEILDKYIDETKKLENVIFCGRLAQYKYYNMDQVVENSLKLFENISFHEKPDVEEAAHSIN